MAVMATRYTTAQIAAGVTKLRKNG